jgi:hypothetical protein
VELYLPPSRAALCLLIRPLGRRCACSSALSGGITHYNGGTRESIPAAARRRYSPRCRRVDIARSASRRSCRSRSACRLSYSRLPFATAISTLALPSLK